MTDLPKLVSLEAKATPHSDARMQMYKLLTLGDDHVEFLESEDRIMGLSLFEIGVERIPMYGCTFRMSIYSDLMKSILRLDPPYHVAPNMLVYGGALTILWLYLNGFTNAAVKIGYLSLKGFFNLYGLLNYFVINNNGKDILEIWNDEFRRRMSAASEQDILENSDSIVSVINNMPMTGNINEKFTNVIRRLVEIDEIGSRLTKVPIIKIYENFGEGDVDFEREIVSELLGWLDKKESEDPSKLVNFMKQYKMFPDPHGLMFETPEGPDERLIPVRLPHSIILYSYPLSGPDDEDEFYEEVSSALKEYSRIKIPGSAS